MKTHKTTKCDTKAIKTIFKLIIFFRFNFCIVIFLTVFSFLATNPAKISLKVKKTINQKANMIGKDI